MASPTSHLRSISALSLWMACSPGLAAATTFTDPKFSEVSLAGNLDPTAMAIAPDGRIFVCSKAGSLRVIKGGQLLTKPFLKLTVPTASEQGLVGVAFHPDFPAQPFVYVYYTTSSPTEHNRVSRFRADGDTAIGAEQPIFDLDNVTAQNHMGGAIHFGNDGKLYVSSGNSARSEYGLDMTSTLGKILRLNPDGTIPSDNPFMDKTTGKAQAIWTAGMRNTFTFSIDKVTGRLFGCEVGDGSEEVNELIAGSNYGYGRQEGYKIPSNTTGMVGTFRPAIYSYNGGCIIAASFYTPSGTRNFPESFYRKFFFADYNNGWVKVLDIDNPLTVSDFAAGTQNPVGITFGADGAMYYLTRARAGGSLMKVTYEGGPLALFTPAKAGRFQRGWGMRADIRAGLLWPQGADVMEIQGLDGRSFLTATRNAGEMRVPLPGAVGDGAYFIRFR